MNAPAEKTVVIEDLRKILAEADRIVVKGSPRSDARTLFESTEKKDLDELLGSLVLKTPTHGFHCMCAGAPAISVYERGRQRLELTNHHGLSIRCSLWDSDVQISDPEKWLYWFDHRGIPGPRQEFENLRTQEKQAQRDRDKWLAAMPEPIRLVWSDALGQFGSVNIAPLRASLERDIPDEGQRILVLLEWFGSGAGPWSGFPSYETAAEKLLLDHSTKAIITAIESTQLSAAQTEGAARLFAGWSFGKQRPEDLKDVPDSLKKVLSANRHSRSFHEKADPCQELVLLFPIRVFGLSMICPISLPFSQAASVATLPSALFVERLSPGASWVFLIQ